MFTWPADTWMAYFTGLSPERRVKVFKAMWHMCSGAEQSLIVKDIKFFFLGVAPGAPDV